MDFPYISPPSIPVLKKALGLAEEDVEGLLGGLPALLDGLAAADPGDLGFGGPATRFDPAPELGGGTA